jgi:quercetin dioxygenase-like cupin family protein
MTDDSTPGSGRYAYGAFVASAADSEVRWMGQTRTHFLATGESTSGEFCLVEETAKWGDSVPLHRHADDVESFYVLEGTIRFFLGEQSGTDATSGTFVHVPAGAVHGFRITSDTARYLILTTPRHGEFYRAITIPAGPDGLPASHDIDWDKIIATAQDFGIEMIGDLPEE